MCRLSTTYLKDCKWDKSMSVLTALSAHLSWLLSVHCPFLFAAALKFCPRALRVSCCSMRGIGGRLYIRLPSSFSLLPLPENNLVLDIYQLCVTWLHFLSDLITGSLVQFINWCFNIISFMFTYKGISGGAWTLMSVSVSLELSSNPPLATILIPPHARIQAAASPPTNATAASGEGSVSLGSSSLTTDFKRTPLSLFPVLWVFNSL